MVIEQKFDFELSLTEKDKLRELLKNSFPGYFESRIYHKQVPSFRLLAKEKGVLVGQVGIDYRVVVSKKHGPLNIFGLIDLCVDESHRGKEIATKILRKVEEKDGIDAIVTFADDQRLYSKLGYNPVDMTCRFLAIEEHESLTVMDKPMADCFMIKFMNEPLNMRGDHIDMLGHIF